MMNEPRETFSVGFMPIELTVWPASTPCAACGRPWSTHDADDEPAPCGLCGVGLSTRCYYGLTATAAEVARRNDPEDEMDGVIFCCLGCRS
jgi:hypothetical protein